jgi:hypothetical protein
MMFLVLVHLVEVGSAESGEIADSLGFNRKYISLVLCRCFRRGFVSRTPYRRGRKRGYIYRCTEKGAKWISHKFSSKETAGVPPKPEKETAKVPVPVFVAVRPKSLFDEPLRFLMNSYSLWMTQDALLRKSSASAVRRMAMLKMCTDAREESEAWFLLDMSENKRRMKNEKQLLAEVAKEYQELFSDSLRLYAPTRAASTGAAVSQRRTLLKARLKAGMTGPESGIKEISSWQESSKTEAAKKEPLPKVSSENSDLDRWWNNLPTVPLELPESLFPRNNPNMLQAALDAGFPACASRKNPRNFAIGRLI